MNTDTGRLLDAARAQHLAGLYRRALSRSVAMADTAWAADARGDAEEAASYRAHAARFGRIADRIKQLRATIPNGPQTVRPTVYVCTLPARPTGRKWTPECDVRYTTRREARSLLASARRGHAHPDLVAILQRHAETLPLRWDYAADDDPYTTAYRLGLRPRDTRSVTACTPDGRIVVLTVDRPTLDGVV